MDLVDIHSHVLPGIDDGAKDLEQSMQMLALAAEAGTRTMIATPHILPGMFDNTPQTIGGSYRVLQQRLRASELDIELLHAAEVHLSPEIMLWQQRGSLPYLGNFKQRKVLLLELPHARIPQGLTSLLRWLSARGVSPLIAHPERNRGVWKAPYTLEQWRQLGCLFQVTGGALVGEFRQEAQNLAEHMLEQDLVDVVASDCHGAEKRSPDLRPAFKRVTELAGAERAERLFKTTPGEIAATCSGGLAKPAGVEPINQAYGA